jgi:hypothetical protein
LYAASALDTNGTTAPEPHWLEVARCGFYYPNCLGAFESEMFALVNAVLGVLQYATTSTIAFTEDCVDPAGMMGVQRKGHRKTLLQSHIFAKTKMTSFTEQ